MRWWLPLVLVSCTRVEHSVWPQLPEIRGARALIFLLEDGRGRSRFAYDLDENGSLSTAIDLVALRADGDPRLTALYYQPALEEFGLAQGELEATDDCALGHPMMALESTGNDWLEVQPSDGGARLVDPVTCRLTNVCRTFVSDSIAIPEAGRVRLALKLDATRTLIGLDSQLFYEVTENSITPVETYRGLPALSGIFAADGSLWLGGIGGRVVRGPKDGPFKEALDGRVDESIVAIAETEGHRVLAVGASSFEGPDSTVRLYELAPNARTLGEAAIPDADPELGGLLTWGERAIAAVGENPAMHLDGDRVEVESLDEVHPFIKFFSTAIAHGEAYVGATAGIVYRSTDFDEWVPINEGVSSRVQAMSPYSTGVVFAGQLGEVGQYYPLRAPCPIQNAVATNTRVVVELGEKLLVAGFIETSTVNRVFFLRPQ